MTERSPVKRALLAQRARADAGGIAAINGEPIAIVGLACRFPGGAYDAESLWRLLAEGRDGVSEVPRERWDMDAHFSADPEAPGKATTRFGGFLDDIDRFDADFFGIAAREARSMDPQQRLLLELGWEALEHAGIVPARLAGSATGVFVGIATNDYGHMLQGLEAIDPYFGTGNNASVAAGRIAYLLGLHGPAMAVDTACSSSLVAVHLACASLHAEDCDLALVAGVNVMLRPDGMIYFSKLGAMAKDGRCKSFDDAADGYVRSEGCATLVLRRLGDALRAGDHIHALIVGSAINHDGRSNGMTAPSGRAQQAVIREAWRRSGFSPAEAGYFEAHGTGTPLGDPIEVEALAAVIAEQRAGRAGPAIALRSIKTNLGHTESVAGLAGLLAATLSLGHRQIPPHLHVRELNRHIDWAHAPLRVPRALEPWPAGAGPRLSGVSSFGFSGTNAHVVLREWSEPERRAEPERAQLLVVSGPDRGSVRRQLRSLRAQLDALGDAELPALCRGAARRRTAHAARLSFVGRTRQALAAELDLALASDQAPALADPALRGPVFIFAGHGSQWHRMGAGLLDEPSFAEAFGRCDEALAPWVEQRPRALTMLDDAASFAALDVAAVQPWLFAMQVALASLWRSWGVQPRAIIGHSMGEVAAAHVAGVLSLDDAARLIATRSRLLLRAAGQRAMMTVEMSPSEAAGEHGLELAAVNGPRMLVLSGERDRIEALAERARSEGRFCRIVQIGGASHCAAVEPVLPALRAALAGLRPGVASVDPWLLATTEGFADDAPRDQEYWCANLRRPVQFWPAIQRCVSAGYRCFLEVGPHPILTAELEGIEDALLLASSRRDQAERETLLSNLGRYWAAGFEPDHAAVFGDGPWIAPPPYAWARRRYWMHEAGRARPSAELLGGHPLLGRSITLAGRPGARVWQTVLDPQRLSWLLEHCIEGSPVLPGAAYVEMACAAARELMAGAPGWRLTDLELERLLFVASEGTSIQIAFTPADAARSAVDGTLEIWAQVAGDWLRHACVRIAPADLLGRDRQARARAAASIDVAEYYARAAQTGVELGAGFRGLEAVAITDGEAIAEIEAPASLGGLAADRGHPALLDCGLQTLALALFDQRTPALREAWVPVRIAAVEERCPLGARLRSIRARRLASAGHDVLRGEIEFFDTDGELLLALRGVEFRPLGRELGPPADAARWLYALRWARVAELGQGGASSPLWLIPDAAGHDSLAARLATQLRARNVEFGSGPLDAATAQRASPCTVVDLRLLAPDVVERAPEAVLFELVASTRSAVAQRARLVVVTRGAVAVAGSIIEERGLAAAPAWGFSRTVAVEHPELACTLIDLDPTDEGVAALADLLVELSAASRDVREDQLALRSGGVRYACRFVPTSSAELGCAGIAEPTRPRRDGSYLVSGALGGIGRRLCTWLVEQGAGAVIALVRSAPEGEALGFLNALRARGGLVTTIVADVADRAAVARGLCGVRAALPPLRGVFHAAGVLDDATLATLERERIVRVLRPKLMGARVLDEVTRGDPLDHFVLFASTAGVMGAPGQAHHAAANAYLDALAHRRRAQRLPALSLDFGAWSEVGQAAADRGRGERLAAQGMGSIDPRRGIGLTMALLEASEAQVAILPLALAQWRRALPEVERRPLYRELLGGTAASEAGLAPELRDADASRRRALIHDRLPEVVAAVVGRSRASFKPRQVLAELGVDSLMALQIRNRLQLLLGVALPSTLVWQARTLDDLAEIVIAAFERERRPAPTTQPPAPVRDERAAARDDFELATLSDPGIAALLAAEIAAAETYTRRTT